MKEQFATYEISLKLKELGFDEPCLGILDFTKEVYTGAKSEHFNSQEKVQYIFGNEKNFVILAPLWQQCIDWLLKEKKLLVVIKPFTLKDNTLGFCGSVVETNRTINGWFPEHNIYKVFNTYEEAREQAILKALTLIS